METGIWSITKSKYLDDNELENFQEIVMKDIKLARVPKNVDNPSLKMTDEEKRELFDNKHIWMYCLHSVRRELELQMSQYKIDRSEKLFELSNTTDQELILELKQWLVVKAKWRSQAMKMLSVVEQKVIYLKTVINYSPI
jgi:hypothetical protein